MANYIASCRTNYFQVKDIKALEEDLKPIPFIQLDTKSLPEGEGQCVVLLVQSSDGNGWPSHDYDGGEVDLPEIISRHLVEGSVAIFMEVGSEKLRYLVGYAEAINSKGERRSIDLSEIYALAKELTDNEVSEATY